MTRRYYRVYLAIAVILFLITLLGMEQKLWHDAATGRATVRQALLIQLYLFLPYVAFVVVPVLLLERYVRKFPARPRHRPTDGIAR